MTGSQREGRRESSFEVCWGADGTGDLYSSANIRHFTALVLNASGGGVDVAVADGGFLAAKNEHDQEAIMARLVVKETNLSRFLHQVKTQLYKRLIPRSPFSFPPREHRIAGS